MTTTFPAILFINATLFDGDSPLPQPNSQLLVSKGQYMPLIMRQGEIVKNNGLLMR